MSSFSNPKKVMIPCRFSFLHCWEPDSVNGSEPKYSVSAIIPKSDTKTVSAIKAAIEVAKQESLPDFIYSTYNSLLEGGWRMSEIDGMDMLGFLRVRAWSARKEKEKKQPRRAYIDQVWQSLKP